MTGMFHEGLGQTRYNELADTLGIEGDSEEFIAAIKSEKDVIGVV
jgi:hypothetical protein